MLRTLDFLECFTEFNSAILGLLDGYIVRNKSINLGWSDAFFLLLFMFIIIIDAKIIIIFFIFFIKNYIKE